MRGVFTSMISMVKDKYKLLEFRAYKYEKNNVENMSKIFASSLSGFRQRTEEGSKNRGEEF